MCFRVRGENAVSKSGTVILPSELYVGNPAHQSQLLPTTCDAQIIVKKPKPYRNIHIMDRFANFYISEHAHNWYQLNYICDGSVKVRFNDQEYIAIKHDFIILPPLVRHALYTETGFAQIGLDILLDDSKNEIASLVDKTFNRKFHVSNLPALQRIYSNFQNFYELSRSVSSFDRLRVVNMVEYMLFDLLEAARNERDVVFRNEFLYMIANIDPFNTSLTEISSFMHISKNHLERLCRAEFGCGAMEFCSRIKFERCCSMLQNGHTPIKEIANQLGFNDVSHFSVFFKKRMNMTPSQYRRRYGESAL